VARWHPVVNAHAAEWLLRQGTAGQPYAIVRRFEFGDPNQAQIWFRVVTWAQNSQDRELIGWCRTLEAAAAAGWDHRCAYESWRHHLAAKRTDAATMSRERPPAAEMVRFYRAAMRNPPTARRA
jgi:hypothetical protein